MILDLLLVVLSFTHPTSPSDGGDTALGRCQFDQGRSAVRFAVTSFGAEGVGSDLYVFAGHVGRTHAHSLANLDPHFIRYGCDGTVEELPSGGAVQGTALVSFGNDLIAVGGLTARNATVDEPEDLVSIASVRRFDRSTKTWTDLPDLPEPRSSHDAVVLDGKLYVVGGWQLRGIDEEPTWISDMAILDLESRDPSWQSVAQPFRTRALAVTHDGAELVVAGGLTADEKTTAESHLFDVATGTWRQGPELPIQRGLKGFGLAAESLDGQALFSPAGGDVYALVQQQGVEKWEAVASLAEPRFFHELAVVDDTLYAVAGTSRKAHLDSVEAVYLSSSRADFASNPSDAGTDATWAGFRHAARPPKPIQHELTESWRTELPGYGQSAPVIWRSAGADRVLLTTSEGANLETQHLIALDLASGSTVWRRSIDATERFENSDMIARAASTPAVDADRIYALFGSGDLIATDHDGKLLWQRDLANDYGSFAGNHGVGSSVVRTVDAVVVSIARKTYAYVLALDPSTGATKWKTDRLAGPGWTTPVAAGKYVLLVGGTGRLDAVDSASGDLLWSVDGLGGNNVSSPSFRWLGTPASEGGFQIALSATRTGGVSVLGGTDPREQPEILWQNEVSSHYSSPIFSGPCLLTSNGVGGVFCFDPKTGDELWRERLPGPLWATPIETSDGSILAVAEDGTAIRLDAKSTGMDTRTLADLNLDGRAYGAASGEGWLIVRNGSTVVALSPTYS